MDAEREYELSVRNTIQEDSELEECQLGPAKPSEDGSLINRAISGKDRTAVYSSLSKATRSDKIRLYTALSATGNVLPELASGKTIEVVHVTIGYAEFPDDSGEIKTGAKLVLTDSSGTHHVILSQTFIRGFAQILDFMSPLPFDPPLCVSATKTQIKGGRSYYLPKLHQ